jgi:hypothetical protein
MISEIIINIQSTERALPWTLGTGEKSSALYLSAFECVAVRAELLFDFVLTKG